jgi:ribulose-phosphate 3-epimerase
MATVLPAIISADQLALGAAIAELERSEAEMIHVDLMDGAFVPESTFGTRTIAELRRRTRMPIDVHLQVERPERYVDALVNMRVDVVSFHVETTPHLMRLCQRIRGAGLKAGIALNPGTSLSTIDEILDQIDLAVMMTSNPGTSDFLPFTVDKIRRLRAILDQRGLSAVTIAADGGVTLERAPLLVGAGAGYLVAGSAVFKAPGGIIAGVAALGRAAGPSPERATGVASHA